MFHLNLALNARKNRIDAWFEYDCRFRTLCVWPTPVLCPYFVPISGATFAVISSPLLWNGMEFHHQRECTLRNQCTVPHRIENGGNTLPHLIRWEHSVHPNFGSSTLQFPVWKSSRKSYWSTTLKWKYPPCSTLHERKSLWRIQLLRRRRIIQRFGAIKSPSNPRRNIVVPRVSEKLLANFVLIKIIN